MSLKIDRVQLEIVVQQDKARQKMLELEKDMKDANRELGRLKKQFGENSAEYKSQAAVVRNLKQQYDDLFNEIGIGKLSLRELANRQRELNAILRNLDPSLPEWKRYNQQLKEVNARIKELRGTATETGLSIGKVADGFNRYMGLAAGAVATLTGMTLTMRQSVEEYARMEEAESQVIKYTGMTREEVKQLNEEFKSMDTRTPREELNRLAGEAGKLGITGIDNVRDFVEAANMINVALGEDLGEDAVNQIGKLSQMFGDEGRSLKENMLAIGSAVNQVAQSSSASEPYLVQFTARMGGVGKQAKMSVTDIMGFASALDQNMLRSEMASTALSGLILRLYQEPAKYAKLARMDVEEFARLVETDVNEAVMQFLEALNKMGGMAQIAPILKEMQLSGAEAASVISTLAGNVEQVRREQENANKAFTEGTSIVNEFGVQNSTVQAELEKARKAFQEVRVELGERLQPVMKYMISAGSLTVKGLLEIINAVGEYKGEIAAVVTAIAAYTTVVKAHTIATKGYELATKAATVATRVLNTVTKASPWGLVIAGVTAVVSYLTLFRGETDKTAASIRKMGGEMATEQTKLDSLFTSLKKANEGSQLRRDLIKEINENYGQYLPQLLTEKSGLDEIEKAYQRINTKLTEQIALKYKNQDISEVANDEGEKQIESIEEVRKSVLGATQSQSIANDAINDLKQITAEFYNAGARWQDAYAQAYHSIKVKYYGKNSMSSFAHSDMEAYIESYYRMQQEIARINQKYANWVTPGSTKKTSTQTEEPVNTTPPVVLATGGTGETDALQARQAELEQQYRTEVNLLKQKYLKEQLTQEEYERQMYAAESAHLEARKALLEQFGQDTGEIQGQIYDRMIAEANRRYQEQQALEKELMEVGDAALEVANKQIEDYKKGEKKKGLDAINATTDYDRQLSMLEAMYDADLLSYEEYQQTKDRLAEKHEQSRMETAQQALGMVSQAASAASQLVQTLQDRELQKVEDSYDRRIEAARKQGKDTTKLEEEKEAALNEVRKKYADKQFAANVLQIASDTAAAIMRSYAQLGPILGPIYAAIVAAQGAIQIAAAKQQRDEAMGLKEGGYGEDYVKGYTRRGNPEEVAGVIPVHKNEFVANHEAVANPAVRQFLDVFDLAQKRGTIRMLNTTQILEQVRTRQGRYSGGYSDETAGASRPSASPLSGMTAEQRSQVVALLQENNRLLTILTEKELVVDPRKVRDGIRRVERLEKNVSR